ncbi:MULTISPECIES: type VI secretion protein [Pseudomonas]|nr:type VI secretion protein [Pseudomonadaceae bacterium]
MLDRNWLIAAFLLSALLTVGGCSGNFKYNDDEYRPLGEPATLNREQ